MAYNEKKLAITRVFDAPIELVWKAITDVDLLKQWSPFFTDFRAEIGFETQFILGPDPERQYLHICRVIDVVEGKKLTYSWAYDKEEGDSLVTFELSARGEKTEVLFTHEIVKPFPKDNPDFAIGSFEQGWTYTMDALRKFVEGNTASK